MDIGAAEVFMFLFLLFYSAFAFVCLLVAFKRFRKHLKDRKKPRLKIIDGGKKEKGPYADL